MSPSRKATFVCATELTAHRQAQCLAHYTDRYTGDHKPAWAQRTFKDGRSYPLQFADDAEWLANTQVAVTDAGELHLGVCHSMPTWPNNPELRTHAA